MGFRMFTPLLLRVLVLSSFALESLNGLTSEGTEFLFAFPPKVAWNSADQCQLVIVSRQQTLVYIESPFLALNETLTVAPFSSTTVNLTGSAEIVGEGVLQRGILVRADRIISLFAFDDSVYGMRRGHLVMPLNLRGSLFYLNTLPRSFENNDKPHSYYAIMASEDNTNVTVYRKTATGYAYELSQVLPNHQYTMIYSSENSEDQSGWKISSSGSISVISGHGDLGYCLQEKCSIQTVGVTVVPSYALGTVYLVPGMAGSNETYAGSCVIRVVAVENQTTIVYNDQTSPDIIDEGELLEFGRPNFEDLSRISCSKPCSVSLFCGQANMPPSYPPLTGTFQLAVIPEHCFSRDVVFSTAIQADPMSHYLSIVVRGGETEVKTVFLDGASLGSSSWQNATIGAYSYMHTSLPVAPGAHHLLSTDGNLWTAYLYGHFHDTGDFGMSYGYPVGFNVTQILSRT